MAGNIRIRLMKKEDLDLLARIYVKVYTDFDVGEKWDKESALKMLDYWFRMQPDLSFVAELDNKVVGAFLAGIKPWCDGNRLVDGEIFVDTGHQNRKIGTELCKALYKKALEKYNVVCFDTVTFKMSEFPLSWYKSQGFKEVDDLVMISGNVKEVLERLERK